MKTNRHRLGVVLAGLVVASCASKQGAVRVEDGLPAFSDRTLASELRPEGMFTNIDCRGNAGLCLADPLLENSEIATETVFDVAVRALVALDPRYQDYFRQSLFYLSHFPELTPAKNAYAYFNAVAGYTIINDFEKWRQQDRERHAALASELSKDTRPSLGLYRVVQMMVYLSNEYTHWRHYKNGILKTWSELGHTDEGCALYARMQHSSDLMSLDMLGRLFDVSQKRQDARLGYAVIGGARTLMGDALAASWVESMTKKDAIALRRITQDMSRRRLKSNNDLQDCPTGDTDTLPWIKTPLPSYQIKLLDEPLTQLRYNAL